MPMRNSLPRDLNPIFFHWQWQRWERRCWKPRDNQREAWCRIADLCRVPGSRFADKLRKDQGSATLESGKLFVVEVHDKSVTYDGLTASRIQMHRSWRGAISDDGRAGISPARLSTQIQRCRAASRSRVWKPCMWFIRALLYRLVRAGRSRWWPLASSACERFHATTRAILITRSPGSASGCADVHSPRRAATDAACEVCAHAMRTIRILQCRDPSFVRDAD